MEEKLLKIIKKNIEIKNVNITNYKVDEKDENIVYVHYTVFYNLDGEDEEEEYELEGDTEYIDEEGNEYEPYRPRHNYYNDILEGRFDIIDIEKGEMIVGTEEQQAYLEKLENDGDI